MGERAENQNPERRSSLCEFRPIQLGDDTFETLIAFEKALRSIHDFVPARELAKLTHSKLSTGVVSGCCRWLEREGYVHRNEDYYDGASWWGLTQKGLELLRDSE